MARDTTKRSGAKSIVPKRWQATDGINALPATVRAKVTMAMTKFRLGEPPKDDFFAKSYDTEAKMAIACELVIAHVGREDIARLLALHARARIHAGQNQRTQCIGAAAHME
jgi:hypothetical protein